MIWLYHEKKKEKQKLENGYKRSKLKKMVNKKKLNTFLHNKTILGSHTKGKFLKSLSFPAYHQ